MINQNFGVTGGFDIKGDVLLESFRVVLGATVFMRKRAAPKDICSAHMPRSRT